MIDIHCHILYNEDDGSKDIETSLKMLDIAWDDGISDIISTPHHGIKSFTKNWSKAEEKIGELNLIAKEKGIKIHLGSEILISRNLPKYYREGDLKTLAKTNYILIEFPFDSIPEYALDTLYELKVLKLMPIVAHPERYIEVIEKPSKLNEFIDEGILFQINSGSLTGLFGRDVKRTAEILIKHGIVNFIASDAHSLRRSPKLKDALNISREISDSSVVEIEGNMKNFFKGIKALQKGEKVKEKKGIFSFFK